MVEEWRQTIVSDEFQRKKEQFQHALLDWYKINGRDLPWRRTRDPYAILVSELMLQQTQVDRVAKDFFFQFLEKFPSFETVASASEEEIIAAWEGLGYYNRARNLHQLAMEVVNNYGGQFPHDRDQILALPGIGEYTAGAVMTFALEIRAPLVDTNVDRVYSRSFLYPEKKISDSQRTKILWLLAESLLPDESFWEFNEGIMDLGAMVCVASKPLCAKCPERSLCQYYAKNSLLRFF